MNDPRTQPSSVILECVERRRDNDPKCKTKITLCKRQRRHREMKGAKL